MTINDSSPNRFSEVLDDYYLAQNRYFIDQYLAEQNLTRESLQELPEEKALEIFRHALDYAAEKIARLDAMIRLGQRDADTKMDTHVKRRHTDRLEHWFLQKRKGK